ncbi:MAG: biosynthetic-type acetolactate synthase large subunit [Oscillospiraceae bacterium]|nr:biosynthetic-type acetolactate synthase large subunit [Oscillospiraceae bacterium]
MNGAEYIINFLERKETEIIFGYPGGAVLTLYDALYRAAKRGGTLRHVLTRHEQGAVHAAEGYAQTTSKTGVVFATSGPGAANLVTGLADAMLDSVPIFAVTGQVDTADIGKDAFQEADMLGVSLSITKHNYLVRDIKDLPVILEEAWQIARRGRLGPVLVDVPKDIFSENIDAPNEIYELCEQKITKDFEDRKIKSGENLNAQKDRILELFTQSLRPVILAGGGVSASKDAPEYMQRFMDKFNIPCAVSLMGKSVLDTSPPFNGSDKLLALGMAGMHGIPIANTALSKSDLVIAAGTRFSDRTVGNPRLFSQFRAVIHADIDIAEISKNVKANVAVVSDAAEFFKFMTELSPCEVSGLKKEQWAAWVRELKKEKDELDIREKSGHTRGLKMRDVIKKVVETVGTGDNLKNNISYITDVGQHQMIAAQEIILKTPRTFVTSGGLGTMGFGLPAAIGAAIGRENKKGRQQVILFSGDGGIQMNIQELATLKKTRVPVKIFILENKRLGMVRQWQEKFYNGRYSYSTLDDNPDFTKIAEAYGIKSAKIHTRADMSGLKSIIDCRESVLVHVQTDPGENVYPMIPAGKSNHEMLFAKDFRRE